MKKEIVLFSVVLAVVIGSEGAAAAQKICVLSCPDFCTASESSKFCSCKCEKVSPDPFSILGYKKPGSITYSPTWPGDPTNSGDLKAKGKGRANRGSSGSMTYVKSDSPDARPGETAGQTWERHEYERIKNAIDAANAIHETQRAGGGK
ncbi:hypothetical protein [Bradyrhizobium sp. SZCCHNRI2010]|uniref:hypothetical protein n=1 Tax=Bradyrhizobium sp. SZCCHNRI2010 TaxID=3057283 RepID=UPI0028E3B65E|nr:hypothetical protein [Bradyrhizobium sp. SZCCHNRI2010]